MAKQYRSIDPTLVALNAAKKVSPQVKKQVPVMSTTGTPLKPSLNAPTQQPQAPTANITPPTPSFGGISSPFGATNINQTPNIGASTPNQIGAVQSQLNNLPKQIPATGTPPVAKLSMDDFANKIKEKYPEYADRDNKTLAEAMLKKYPEYNDKVELQTTTPIQGGLKGGASRQGFNLGAGEWINPIGKVFEEIDNQLQRIPTVSQDQVKGFLNNKLGGFGADFAMLPTMAINTPGSLLKTAGATGRGLTNPLDTLTGLYNLVASKEGRQALGDRYGSIEGLQKTISEDPVGVASDILTVVQGGAGLAGKGAKLAGLPKTATKLGQISDIAGGASNLGMDILPQGLNTLASKPGVIGKVATVLNAPVSPLQTAGKLLPKQGVKEYTTREFPISRIEKDLGLTPTSRAIVERTGVTPGEYMLSKNLGGVARETQINELAKIADESYNGMTNQLKNIKTRTPSPDAQKMLTTMVDEMESSKILAREYPDYIAKLNELGSQADYSPIELLAIRRDFDRIVGNQMFNAQGRVSGVEDKTIAGRRSKLADQLETIGNENGIDIREMNTDIRNSTAIRDGLLRRLSQENKNNTFGLQDIGVGAILSAGNPVVATAIVIGKKALENAVQGISQSLYNINKAKNVPRNLNRGVPITPTDTTNGLSITPRPNGIRTTAGEVALIEPKRLPLKEGATVFPGPKGQLGNTQPTPKSTSTVRETGVIGQPYKVPEPPKNKPAPQIGNGTKPKLGKETLEQDLVSEAKKYKSAEEFIKAEPVLKVKIESIKPTEGHTQENTLGTNGVARKEFRNKPILVEVDSKDPSKLYILDGNHRYFEQLSRGDKEVTVKVNGKGIDTDGYKARLKSIREQANKPSLGKPKVPGK